MEGRKTLTADPVKGGGGVECRSSEKEDRMHIRQDSRSHEKEGNAVNADPMKRNKDSDCKSREKEGRHSECRSDGEEGGYCDCRFHDK